MELGPLLLNDLSLADPLYNSTGIPQLVRNPWAWSSVANLLVVDNPPPVGFSYCEPAGVRGDGYSCGNWTDSLVALANAEALRNFGALFPTSFAGGVYLIGESYAGELPQRPPSPLHPPSLPSPPPPPSLRLLTLQTGVYVPVIFEQLMSNPGALKLGGLAVGDPCLGLDVFCGPGLFKVLAVCAVWRACRARLCREVLLRQWAAAHRAAGPIPRPRIHVTRPPMLLSHAAP